MGSRYREPAGAASADRTTAPPPEVVRRGLAGYLTRRHPARGERPTMKAVTWQGKRNVQIEEVPDPKLEEPTDAIVRITSTGICGSDLHLYEVLGPFLDKGDVLGHEPMGVVEEVGSEVSHIVPGGRVVIPFTIACGHCYMCAEGLQSQCETTQVRDQGIGAALFGYTGCTGRSRAVRPSTCGSPRPTTGRSGSPTAPHRPAPGRGPGHRGRPGR
jgi:hypothetical protein